MYNKTKKRNRPNERLVKQTIADRPKYNSCSLRYLQEISKIRASCFTSVDWKIPKQ